MENIRVIIWGFGAMGSGMARMILKKEGVEIVGICARNKAHVGKDMYELLGIDRGNRKPLIITNEIASIAREGQVDVALIATDSFIKASFDKIKFIVEQKINVVSVAEEMAYPQAQEPELAKEMDALAKENGVTILGTGINPGFVLDLLILALTGTCEDVEHIKAVRVNDLSPFGRAVMREQGVGLTETEFENGVANGTVAGHVGFPESISMVAEGIGWGVERIEQTREAIISNTYRETKHVTVKKGKLAGCRQCGYGYVDGEIKIEMEHPQQILPETEGTDTGDYIWIKGTPNVNMQIKPEIPGGIGTIAMCVNMIPHVINAHAGLVTMLDLPVPRAIMGDMRKLVRK